MKRHWKQKFDRHAEMRVIKPLRTPSNQMMNVGDILPEGMFSVQKLKMLWNSNFIELADWEYKAPHDPHAETQLPAPDAFERLSPDPFLDLGTA